jgi:rare lipoprotein A
LRFGRAALVCALSLLLAVPMAGAAVKKPAGKPAAAGKLSKPPLPAKAVRSPKPAKTTRPVKAARLAAAATQTAEVGFADIIERDSSGLHGHASFYGHGFQGRRTATGARFDVRQFTAASNHFPLGSKVAVRRLDNERCAIVVVNDRMHVKHRKRVIDVSRGVAEYLDMIRAGVVLVRVAPLKAHDSGCHAAFEAVPCIDCDQTPKLPEAADLDSAD